MTEAKLIKHEPALVRLARRPGGLTPQQAIAAAESNLAVARETILEKLDAMLAEIQAAAASPIDTASRAALYRLANGIVGVAGALALPDLAEAAYSLCDLVDKLDESGGWNDQAVAVHLNSLKVLRTPGNEDSRQAILDGLARIVAAA